MTSWDLEYLKTMVSPAVTLKVLYLRGEVS